MTVEASWLITRSPVETARSGTIDDLLGEVPARNYYGHEDLALEELADFIREILGESDARLDR